MYTIEKEDGYQRKRLYEIIQYYRTGKTICDFRIDSCSDYRNNCRHRLFCKVTTNEIYNSKSESAAVYTVPVYTEDETKELAEDFFASLGQVIDDSRTNLYDETAGYYSTEQNSRIDYTGGTMNFEACVNGEKKYEIDIPALKNISGEE